MGLTTKRAGVAAWVRVSAYVALLHVIGGVTLLAAARARTDGALLQLGQLVMDYAEATHQQTPRTVVLNGAQLQLSVGASERSVSEVLEHFQRQCASRGGGLGAQLHDVLVATGSPLPASAPPAALWDGVYRAGDETRGVVACLDLGQASITMDELARRAQRMSASGDLSELGHLRFVSVERGEQRTVFSAMWTEGAINVRQMFPSDGDAPGFDPVGVPRPVRARRVLSAWEHGQDKALHAYRVDQTSLATTRKQYLAQLTAAGFTLVDDNAARADGTIAQRGERAFAVAFTPVEETSALVTISSLNDATGTVTGR